MSNPLAELVAGRSGSALSDVLTEAPRLVDSVAQELPPAVESAIPSLSDLFRHSSKPALAAVPADDDDEPYIPLTADEIKTKAESKAQMWGALIALFFGFIHRYAAYQKLREGDKQLIKEYDNSLKLTNILPSYPADHPYHAARERWQDFEEALQEADDEARLSDAQVMLLQRAIEADLRSKNKRGQLKSGSIAEVLFEIAVIKAMAPLMQVSMLAVNKMVDKSMR
ncbi:hypothetical protein GCM10027578_22010 [Spirosoma luteolum]